MENFRRQLSKTVPGPIRKAEDLLDLPSDILDDILTELGIEDVCEAMRLMEDES